MTSLQASRTLVKSPPELWAELSDVGTLARHLGEFGEIRITKSHPEARVEWEADRASGTVRLEPTGWGTRVVLTVETPDAEAHVPAEAIGAEPEPEPMPEPVHPPPLPAAPARRSLWDRLLRRRPEPPAAPEPAPVAVVAEPVEPVAPAESGSDRAYGTIEWQTPEPPAEEEPPPPAAVGPDEAHAVLTNVLDTLGAAHHRPFSRS